VLEQNGSSTDNRAMTATLPTAVQQVFDRFVTTEFTTVDKQGQPITWPLTPYYRPGDDCISVTTGLGYPKKANDAAANPKVAALFSDPTGSGLDQAPQVLVQGTAHVDDHDLQANAARYKRELAEKLPEAQEQLPPKVFDRWMLWYLARIYIHVRPERIYVWENGDVARAPQLFDARLEEVRSGHDEEPPAAHAGASGGAEAWDERLDELGDVFPDATVTLVAPDGFPFSVRLPVEVDRGAHRIRLGGGPVGVPWQPGLACVTAHDHPEQFRWQRNFQVRGDLVEEDGAWSVVPRKLVGGFELPPGFVTRTRLNLKKFNRFRRTAKRELAARS
jgi:Pyridoxamine 5'-phosphate oxidase